MGHIYNMDSAGLLNEFIANFHWQRPIALFIIPIALLLLLVIRQSKAQTNRWHQYIDKNLLSHLMIDGQKEASTAWIWLLFIAFMIGALALAGPAWEKIPQPVHKKDDALVILFDLSPSMMAEDVKPSRLIRARYKLIDLLKQRGEGQTALIAYSGEAHIVSPLTDDTETIINLLPALSPATMPLQGSNTEMAVRYGIKLLKDSGRDYGNILLLSDGIVDAAVDDINTQLSTTSYGFYVLGVGTSDGGPIPSRSGFVKDSSGGIVIARLNQNELIRLASSNGGRYQQLQQSDRDIDNLVSDWENSLTLANNNTKPFSNSTASDQDAEPEREFDQWQDQGFWLVFLLLPFALLGFRRGWLLAVFPAILIFSSVPETAMAQASPAAQNTALNSSSSPKDIAAAENPNPQTSLWNDLWQTRDQQAMDAYEHKDFKRAGELFENEDWRGAAKYHSGEFESAQKEFTNSDSSQNHYNKGNALARSGKLNEAIGAYSEALKSDPENSDAKFNLDLVKEIQEQEEKDKEEQDSKDDESQEKQEGDEGKDGDEQKSDQNEEQKDKEKQGDEKSDESKDGEDNEEPKDENEGTPEENKPEKEDPSEGEKPKPEENEQQSEEDAKQAQSAANPDDLSDEEQQALEQWLQQVPDDPAGLLRNKFKHQYQERRRAYREGRWQPPENDADERL